MKLKSYFSGTVEAAMELARKELGEDALLVNARPAAPEARYLGDYEVVFGVTDPDQGHGLYKPGQDDLASEIANLKREFERIVEGLGMSASAAQQIECAKPPYEYARLVEQELETELAESVAAGAKLETLFATDSTLGIPGTQRRIVALVGPPGAGKTTTLVKLAAIYGLPSPVSCQILSADVHRIAAADQLRSLASLLGIGCEIAETPAVLAQLLESYASKELVFIDTPGLTWSEMEDGQDLVRFMRSRADFDTHLVLPANLHPRVLTRTVESFGGFGPTKLLFTRTDEAVHFGPLINESARWALPISFLANGQHIPDDIQPASTKFIAERISFPEGRAVLPAAMAKGAGV